MIPHTRAADVAAGVSGASFVTAHWFLVTDQLVHFGANVVSIVTGIAASVFYGEKIYQKIKAWLGK